MLRTGMVLSALFVASFAASICLLDVPTVHPLSTAPLRPSPRRASPSSDARVLSKTLLASSSSEDGDAAATTAAALSHAMLRVENVNATVAFWRERGARLRTYRRSGATETAFVDFGTEPIHSPSSASPSPLDEFSDDGQFFALEITSLPPGEVAVSGNAVRYIGLSMLIDYDPRLAVDVAKVVIETKPPPPPLYPGAPRVGRKSAAGEVRDPNGLKVRKVASAPGDYLARLCLRASNDVDLEDVAAFYVDGLGMERAAADDNTVCLRCKPAGTAVATGAARAPVTLVFERGDGEEGLIPGNCFDHLAVATRSVSEAESKIRSAAGDVAIFQGPTRMFGTTIMGLKDPNGYKVYLVEQSRLKSKLSLFD